MTENDQPRLRQQSSDAEEAFLDAHSGTRANPMALRAARLRSEIESSRDLEESLTVEQAAELLGVSDAATTKAGRSDCVRILLDAGRSIPHFALQFIDGRETPHLGEVLQALPDDLSALDVKAFVLNARVDHPTEEGTFGLLDWLRAGNDPAPAIVVARE